MNVLSNGFSPPSILIADDDDIVREIMRAELEADGFRVVEAVDGVDACQKCWSQLPDLVIADLRLGGFNGLQLLLLSPQPIPTIIVTGFHDEVLEAEARRAGADYVVKPISPSNLVTLVKERLERKSGPH